MSDIADYSVITDDNPPLKGSQEVMHEIQKGINPNFHDYVLIKSRQQIIENIINYSEVNYVVILEGKGHETYQILRSEPSTLMIWKKPVKQ